MARGGWSPPTGPSGCPTGVPARMDAVQHGIVDRRPRLRLDLGRHGAVGLGPLPLRALVLRRRLLGLGARPRDRAARCTPPRSSPSLVTRVVLGRTGGRPVGWVALGWGEPVVPWWGRPGCPWAVLARMGWSARREQRGRQQHHRGERAEHHRLPERDRAARGRGRRSGALRPRPDHPRARRPGGRAEAPAARGRAADLATPRASCRRRPAASGRPRRS